MSRRPQDRVRPLEALRAIRALIADPDDTAQVFRIVRALAGGAGERGYQRFVRSEHGPRILAERRRLADRLADRESLRALPPGSLGRTYAEFAERERIGPEGLIAASDAAPEGAMAQDADRQLFLERLRDMHDLWHVVTGYGRDLVGEAALLAFTYRQTRNRGIGFIVAVAWWRAGRQIPQQRGMIRDGLRRGRAAAWLPAADWEALLEQPLDEVRRTLGVEPVDPYEPLRSQGAPALA